MFRVALSLAVMSLLAASYERQALAGPAAPAPAEQASSAVLADLAAQIAAVHPGQESFDLCVPDEVRGQEAPLHAAMAAKGLFSHGYTTGEGCRIYHYRPGEPRESDLEFINGTLGTTLTVSLGFSSLAALIIGVRTRRRIARDEARRGCVACGSTKVRIDGDTITCLECQYTGRADRGGALLESEIAVTRPSSANGL